MKLFRTLVAGIGATALVLWCVPAALAQSTDIYPAGDAVSASSTPVTITGVPLVGTVNCTFNPGSFTIPKGNSSGPVTANFTTRPSYTNCKVGESEAKVETSGTWTITAQYGSAATTITIPASGFRMTLSSLELLHNTAGAWTLNGVWNNGFASPVSVSSSIDQYPSKNTDYYEGQPKEVTFGSALSTLSDVTHPGSLLLLGP